MDRKILTIAEVREALSKAAGHKYKRRRGYPGHYEYDYGYGWGVKPPKAKAKKKAPRGIGFSSPMVTKENQADLDGGSYRKYDSREMDIEIAKRLTEKRKPFGNMVGDPEDIEALHVQLSKVPHLVVGPLKPGHNRDHVQFSACQKGTLRELFDLEALAGVYERNGLPGISAHILSERGDRELSSYFEDWDFQDKRTKPKDTPWTGVQPWETGLILGYPVENTLKRIYGVKGALKKPSQKEQTLHERFGHQGAPKPGEKGYREAPKAAEGALDGRTGAELASDMFDAATALLDDPELQPLIHPEWEEEWRGYSERHDTPQDELEEDMATLAALVGVPHRGLDGTPAPLQDRSDLAHNMLALAAEVRDGVPPTGGGVKDEYVQGWQVPRWAAVASVEDRLTGKTKNRLVLVPKAEAFAFVKEHHSVLGEGHKLPPGTMYAIGIKRGDRLVAVALAGHPTGGAMKRAATPRSTVELTRVASDGTTKNAASMLTARILDVLERSKRDEGAPSLFVTYSLLSESGTTYRALKDKGLRPVAVTRPKKKMTGARQGGKGLAALPKIRWEAGEDAREANWGLLELTKKPQYREDADGRRLKAEQMDGRTVFREVGSTFDDKEKLSESFAGPHIGPRGGAWADAANTIPFKEGHHAEIKEKVGPKRAKTPPVHFATGKPISIPVTHRKQKTQDFGSRYGQDIEPAGRYVVHGHDGKAGVVMEPGGHRVETIHDTLELKRPLVIHHRGTAGKPGMWKRRLSDQYGGKTGKALSRAIAADGYDAIVTVEQYNTSEIVDLSRFQTKREQLDLFRSITMAELRKGGPYVGPRGGKWADAKHKIPWRESIGRKGPKEIQKAARVLSWGEFLRKSPFIGPKGGLWEDAAHKIPWKKGKKVHPSKCPRCKGVAHIISRQSTLGGKDTVSSAPCRTCNKGGRRKLDEKRAKALGLPIPPPQKKAKRAPPEREQPSKHAPDPRQAGLFDKPKPARKKRKKPYRYGDPGIGRHEHLSPQRAHVARTQMHLELSRRTPATLRKAAGHKYKRRRGYPGHYEYDYGYGWGVQPPKKAKRKARARQLSLFGAPDPEPEHDPKHVPGDDAPPDDDQASRWEHAKEMSREVLLELDAARARGVHYFASGSNLPGEILGLADVGQHVGVAVQTLRKEGGREAIAQAVKEHPETRIFVDSGAFSEAHFPGGVPALHPPEHKDGISHEEWLRRLEIQRQIGEDIGGQLYAVAPDAVAHQDLTLERMARYASLVRKIAATGANILIPCQKGDLSLPEFWKRALEILKIPEAQAVASIPMMKDATNAEDYGDFLERAQPARVHLLGLGPKGKRFPGILSITEEVAPQTALTCDSVLLSSIAGWFSGPTLPDDERGAYLTESGEEVPFQNAPRALTEVGAGVLADVQEGLYTASADEMTGWDWTEAAAEPSSWLSKTGLRRIAKNLGLERADVRAFVKDPDAWLQVDGHYLDPLVELELERAWKNLLAPDRKRSSGGKPRMPNAPASSDYRKRETIRRLFSPEDHPYEPIEPAVLREMQTTVPAKPKRRVRLNVIAGDPLLTPEQKAKPPSADLLAVMEKSVSDPGEWNLPAGARIDDPWVPKEPKPGAKWSHPDYGSGKGAAPWEQQDDWHPDLHSYDHIAVNSSAGKDSQAMLTRIVELADEQGYPRDKIVVVHADLGRVEWEGTGSLAKAQAEHYGLRFEVVKRQQNDLLEHIEERYGDLTQKDYDVGRLNGGGINTWRELHNATPERVLELIGAEKGMSKWPGDYRAAELIKNAKKKRDKVAKKWSKATASASGSLDKARRAYTKAKSDKQRKRVQARINKWDAKLSELTAMGDPWDWPVDFGKVIAWPGTGPRFCTSDHKRTEVDKLLTQLAEEHKAKTGQKKPARILNALGLRAQESASRQKMPAFGRQTATSNQTVDRWYPIHRWHERRVWDVIEKSGVPHHKAYDLGMRRLSCVFCVYAKKEDLLIAAMHNPELFKTYLELEEKVGASFKADMSLAEVQDEILARRAAGWSLNELSQWIKKSLEIPADLRKAETVQPTAVGLILDAAHQRLTKGGQKIETLTLDWKANGLCVHLDTAVDSHHVEYLPYPAAYNASMVAAAFAQGEGLLVEEHNAPGPMLETDMTKAVLFYVPAGLEELEKGQARGGKYIRRVPYRNPKTGKMGWRYFYRQSAVARGAQAGERVKLGKRYLEVLSVGEGGTVTFDEGGKTFTVGPDEWAEKLAGHYGARYHDWAAKRAHQSINSVLRLVPRKLLLDLKGDTDQERLADLQRRVPAVYGKLRAAFSRAGIDPIRAKHVVSSTLKRRGWEPEARAALLGGVIDKRIIGYREIIRGAENLSGGGLVTAGHVTSAAELRAPGGKAERFKAETDKVAKSAEGELALLSKLLASAHASGDAKDAAKVLEAALGSDALQKLQMLTQAFPGLRVGPVAEESRAALLEVPSVAPRPQTTTEGAETLVYVADANGQPRALKARYKLIEAEEAIASHNAQHFGKRADYPTGVQERQYHTDKSEQRKVTNNARRMNPAFVVNTNPDSVNGPPMLNEDGIVLGGNSRAMSMQLVYLNHPEKAAQMRTYLEDHAHEMGFSPDDVKAVKNPMLVRVIEDPPKESEGGLFGEEPGGTRKRTQAEMGVLVRQMNESFTQSMDPRAMQVAMGRKLTDDTVKSLAEGMEDGETLNQFLTSSRAQPFVTKLGAVGIIDSRNENQYTDPKTHRLNADGRDLVSRILVGRLVGDADVLSNTGARTVDAVAAATPYMISAVKSGAGYELGKDMASAIRDLNELRQRAADKTLRSELSPKLTEAGFAGFFAQLSAPHTGVKGEGAARELESTKNPRAKALLWALIKKPGPRQFANLFKQYAVQAGHNREGSMDLLRAVKTPTEVLEDVVKRATSAKPKPPEEKPEPKAQPSMSLELSRTADGRRYRVHSMAELHDLKKHRQ